MTAKELIEIWPERWPRPEPTTTSNAVSQLKHFARFFGDREIGTITVSDYRLFALKHPGAARYARTALGDLFDDKLIPENVAAGVRIPKKAKREIIIPTTTQLNALVRAASKLKTGSDSPLLDGVNFSRMITTAAYTGLREGELRSLALEDLEDDGETIRRGRVRYSINREERLKEPKTPQSKAPFAFLGPSAAAVADVINANAPFGSPERTPVRPGRIWIHDRGQLVRRWDETRLAAGVACRWHDLRHYCATWLLDQGATVDDVAMQLRCSVDEIRRTYGHADREQALQRLEGLSS